METRTCENCGIEFEGAPQARFHSDACRKAFARAKERGLADESLPARQLDELMPDGVTLRSQVKAPKTQSIETPAPEQEQRLRDFYGYSSSEKRTKAERDAAAARMRGSGAPLTEEIYVAQAVEGARMHFEQTSPLATTSTKTLEETLQRAERYARWRYHGFLSGEVASL